MNGNAVAVGTLIISDGSASGTYDNVTLYYNPNAVPIGEVNINSPLDSGYVAVKTEIGSIYKSMTVSYSIINSSRSS